MRASTSWYVAADEVTAGPVSTELVIKGIEHRRVPPESMVCEVGAARWAPLSSVDEFHAAVVRSYPPPPPASEEARYWLDHGFHFPPPAPLPRFDDPEDLDAEDLDAEDLDADDLADDDLTPLAASAAEAAPPSRDTGAILPPPSKSAVIRAPAPSGTDAVFLGTDDLDVDDLDVDWDEALAVDWGDPFEPFFLVGDTVDLPDEEALLESLASAQPESFQGETALWNLALCLAYGSDPVGAAAARAFFAGSADRRGAERLGWMSRALLGSGFLASGIAEDAGRRGMERLRSHCPPSLSIQAFRAAGWDGGPAVEDSAER